jgi:hypothetical protein
VSEYPCVFVVGMHRSGTSATAGTLDALGVATPSGKDRVGRRKWNARGYFESERMMTFNDRLLACLGGTWAAPPLLMPGWERDHALDSLRPRAAQFFAETFPARPMAWKDPRNCITLPFWRTVVSPPMAAVFVYRDPLEVARSLHARNGAGVTYSLALWDRHVRCAVTNLVGLPTLVADYARVLDHPSSWIGELVDFLRSIGIEIGAPTRQAAIASLDADLRHQHAPVGRSSGVWDIQYEVLEALRMLDGSHDVWRAPDLGPEPGWVDEVLALRLAADKLTRIEETLQTLRPGRIARAMWDLRHQRGTTGFFPRL